MGRPRPKVGSLVTWHTAVAMVIGFNDRVVPGYLELRVVWATSPCGNKRGWLTYDEDVKLLVE